MQDPPRRDGELARKSLLKLVFIIIKGYNNKKINWKNSTWFLYQTNPRAYKVQQ